MKYWANIRQPANLLQLTECLNLDNRQVPLANAQAVVVNALDCNAQLAAEVWEFFDQIGLVSDTLLNCSLGIAIALLDTFQVDLKLLHQCSRILNNSYNFLIDGQS